MTATKKNDSSPEVYGYRDLMRVCGLGRDTVKFAIRMGELPGFKVGRSYVVPAEAFAAFCAGTWVATPRPLFPSGVQAAPTMIHRKVS